MAYITNGYRSDVTNFPALGRSLPGRPRRLRVNPRPHDTPRLAQGARAASLAFTRPFQIAGLVQSINVDFDIKR